MNNYELNKLKRSAIAKAWSIEKKRICKGEGIRDWSVVQQYDILNYNYTTGFVGNFLSENINENNVQFVEMSIEFLCTYNFKKNNQKIGCINIDTFAIMPLTTLSVMKLSKPSYLGYFDSHRELFIGQDTGFGLKVTDMRSNKQVENSYHKNKFGLEDKEKLADSTLSDAAQQRMKNYGF